MSMECVRGGKKQGQAARITRTTAKYRIRLITAKRVVMSPVCTVTVSTATNDRGLELHWTEPHFTDRPHHSQRMTLSIESSVIETPVLFFRYRRNVKPRQYRKDR